MSEKVCLQEEPMGFFDVLGKLCDAWWIVLAGTVLGLLLALAGLMLLQKKYEAIALLQVGQIGLVGQGSQPGQVVQVKPMDPLFHLPQFLVQSVEPPAQTVERIRSPAFQKRVFEALGEASGELIPQVVKSTLGERAPLIELRVRGNSPDAVRKLTEATIAELAARHAEIALPKVEKMQGDLALARERQSLIEKDLEKMGGQAGTMPSKDGREINSCARATDERERFELRQRILALKTALAETFPPRFIEAAYVREDPVSPRKNVLLAFGLLGGLLAGMGCVFVRDAWCRYRKRNKPE